MNIEEDSEYEIDYLKAEIIAQYYKDDAKKLHRVVDTILKHFGGIHQMDYDDFYSLANEVFWRAVKDFNGEGDFNGFLYMALNNKIKSLLSFRNSSKRSDIEIIKDKNGCTKKVFHPTISIESMVEVNNRSVPLSEFIADDCNIEQQWINSHEEFSEKVERYLQMLPFATKKVMLLISEGLKPAEIKRKLHITQEEYNDHLKIATSYEATRVLI